MERKEAGSNMRLGVLLTVLALTMFGLAFVWAVIYLGSSHG